MEYKKRVDQLIATNVMGFLDTYMDGYHMGTKPFIKDGKTFHVPHIVPDYSSSWDGMGLAIQTMNERGYDIYLSFEGTGSNCKVTISDESGLKTSERKFNSPEQAPMTVCLSILETLGVEHELMF